MVQAEVALPGGGGQGIIILLNDWGIGEVNIGRYQQFVGICPGYGSPLKDRF